MINYGNIDYGYTVYVMLNRVSKMIPKQPIKVSENLHKCPKCGVGVFLNSEQCNWCKQILEWK